MNWIKHNLIFCNINQLERNKFISFPMINWREHNEFEKKKTTLMDKRNIR